MKLAPVPFASADIYCDSQLIMRELERRYPTPSFYPAGRGAADARKFWPHRGDADGHCWRWGVCSIRRTCAR
jgi:glutathione S-transferase